MNSNSIRFSPGVLLATRGATALLMRAGVSASSLLRRHLSGDWGDIDPEDQATNEQSLERGLRLLSAYNLEVPFPDTPRTFREVIWIITEADRSATTILLPEEY